MRAVAALIAGAATLLPSLALAQVSLSTEVNPPKVEVGERFMVRLRAMSQGGERATDPQLKLPPGISGAGPSIGSQTSMSISNGQMTQSVGITATWTLSSMRPGIYKIGPGSVETGSGRVQDRVVTVEVVPQGSLPQHPPPLGGQPLDPWGMFRGSPFPGFPGFPGLPDLQQREAQQHPLLPEEYRIDAPLDPVAFLRARAVPKRVVVGEQVTLSVYAYGGRGEFNHGVATEPSRNDFLAINLMDPGRQRQGYQFELNGQMWIGEKVQEFALFPLKAGRLKAGAMSMAFVGRGYAKDPSSFKRESQPVEIIVVEPPLSGRPPGYQLGDVGHYTLSAQVEPREVAAGGSISVVAKLEGTGNLPLSLLVPEQNGVHFLEPQIIDQVAPRSGVVQGFRTFTYVVELNQPGDLELGELTLPYWDPKARAYGVARAALGKIKVTGSAPARSADKARAGHRLEGLIVPPAKLGAHDSRVQRYFTDRPAYWGLLLSAPLSLLLGFVVSDLMRLVSRRLASRRGSLASALDEALAELNASSLSAADAAGVAERALFLSIEKATGLKARGVLKAELSEALRAAGVEVALAERAAELLSRCDEVRFAGEATELSGFVAEVRETCQRLAGRKAREPEPSRP
ncbi:MAG TPA: BatD family protein [Polyangiaceae bacterium]|nr:BatD family protein [Polyangiaceae bacterium]